MALKRNAYRTIERIVGSENISEDPAVLDGYIWQWGAEFIGKGNRFTTPRPEAVVLPGTTEEVQGIVKACNRHGLKFKAHSTGWGAWGAPGVEGVVLMDLRRMNRILEVNEGDMYAVIEPYVIWAQLQVEIMKKGLNCTTIGAGSAASALASCTAVMGGSYNNLSMGYNDRNVLGVEWVLPDGEILRLGSLGSGAGWICGDGPGPSLRGIMRGYWGSFGGFGVFTRCAIRLYQWGGPPEIPSEFVAPRRERFLEFPENVSIHMLTFDNYEKRDEAIFKIGEAEIGYAAAFMGRGLASVAAGTTGKEATERRDTVVGMIPAISFTLVLVANSKGEFEYQKKVVAKILEETEGSDFGAVMMMDPEIRDGRLLLYIKGGVAPVRGVIGTSGYFLPTMCGGLYTRRTIGKAEPLAIEVKRKYVEEGTLCQDMGEGQWGTFHDGAHVLYQENETLYDPNNAESVGAMAEAAEETMTALRKENITSMPVTFDEIGVAKSLKGAYIHDLVGPDMSNYQVWMRKIKAAFDPNHTSDSSSHIE